MQLIDLITAVKEQSLSKDQLEKYRDNLSTLFAEMQIEMSELEKEEALFLNKDIYYRDKPIANNAKQVKWDASENGLRLIVLKRYCLATKELLNSLKSRLYSIF